MLHLATKWRAANSITAKKLSKSQRYYDIALLDIALVTQRVLDAQKHAKDRRHTALHGIAAWMGADNSSSTPPPFVVESMTERPSVLEDSASEMPRRQSSDMIRPMPPVQETAIFVEDDE